MVLISVKDPPIFPVPHLETHVISSLLFLICHSQSFILLWQFLPELFLSPCLSSSFSPKVLEYLLKFLHFLSQSHASPSSFFTTCSFLRYKSDLLFPISAMSTCYLLSINWALTPPPGIWVCAITPLFSLEPAVFPASTSLHPSLLFKL